MGRQVNTREQSTLSLLLSREAIAGRVNELAVQISRDYAGKDALLVCDTREMAAALNRRIHHDTIDPNAPTVAAARGDRIAVGDVIISSRNDAGITVHDPETSTAAANPVRNGNRWREIKTLNRLPSETVAPGTVLNLPPR